MSTCYSINFSPLSITYGTFSSSDTWAMGRAGYLASRCCVEAAIFMGWVAYSLLNNKRKGEYQRGGKSCAVRSICVSISALACLTVPLRLFLRSFVRWWYHHLLHSTILLNCWLFLRGKSKSNAKQTDGIGGEWWMKITDNSASFRDTQRSF